MLTNIPKVVADEIFGIQKIAWKLYGPRKSDEALVIFGEKPKRKDLAGPKFGDPILGFNGDEPTVRLAGEFESAKASRIKGSLFFKWMSWEEVNEFADSKCDTTRDDATATRALALLEDFASIPEDGFGLEFTPVVYSFYCPLLQNQKGKKAYHLGWLTFWNNPEEDKPKAN